MKILVTGGLGFVGVNVVRALADHEGVQVIAADMQPWDAAIERFLAPVKTRIRYCRLDVRDADSFAGLVADEGVTHVIHAAAVTVNDEQECTRAAEVVGVNLGGAINVLNSALRCDHVERVLMLSSSGVYGAPKRPPGRAQREGGALDLTNLYAITKYSAELLAARYGRLTGKPMASLRLSAVYGPMERLSASRPNVSAIQRLFCALCDQRPLRLAGPAVKRDWTYAADIGAAAWAMLHAPLWRHNVYNVSCGTALRFDEAAAAFSERGLAVTWVDDPDQADVAMRPQQARVALDIGRIQRDAGFRPAFSLGASIDDWLAWNSG
jgi:UDP-glucose 4-epimerase